MVVQPSATVAAPGATSPTKGDHSHGGDRAGREEHHHGAQQQSGAGQGGTEHAGESSPTALRSRSRRRPASTGSATTSAATEGRTDAKSRP